MSLPDAQIKELCQKLKPLIGEKADALWLTFTTSETPRARVEAESFINMMAVRHLGGRVDEQRVLLPPPSKGERAGEFLLGETWYAGQSTGALYLTRGSDLMAKAGL